MKIRSQKREGNKVILEAEEDRSRFEESIEKALVEAGKEIRIPGFRPGKAPRDMVERAVNREFIENRAAQNLIAGVYPKIIEEGKFDPVDYPNVEIVQQEKGKPFVFKLSVDVYPAVKLGKYKGLKMGKKSDESEGDIKNKLIAAASAEAKVDIPPAMIEREVDVMLGELRVSLAQSGLTLEDYLRGAKKEESALRQEMRKSAEIRIKGKIMLKAVAEAEKIKVSAEEIQAEIKAIEIGEKMEEAGRKYVEEYLLRKKALDFIVDKASIKEVSG